MAETTITETETTVADSDETEPGQQSPDDGLTGWFGTSTLRIGLAILGFFLLLAALGQLSGLDLIGMGAEAINTDVGRWFIVAVIAIGLIIAAARGFGRRATK